MTHAYILKNQHDLFLDKHGQWVDQADSGQLYRTLHKDEAINCMVEYSVKNPDLRIKVEACELNAKGQLVLAQGSDTDEPRSAIDREEPHLFAAQTESVVDFVRDVDNCAIEAANSDAETDTMDEAEDAELSEPKY